MAQCTIVYFPVTGALLIYWCSLLYKRINYVWSRMQITCRPCSPGCGRAPRREWTRMQRTCRRRGSPSPVMQKVKDQFFALGITSWLCNKLKLTAVEMRWVGGPETTDWQRLCMALRIAGTRRRAALFWNIFTNFFAKYAGVKSML